jgi:hypothetical protein
MALPSAKSKAKQRISVTGGRDSRKRKRFSKIWQNLAFLRNWKKPFFVSTLASQVHAFFEFFFRLRLGHSSTCMADSIPGSYSIQGISFYSNNPS